MIIEKINNGNVLVKTDTGEIKASLGSTMILHTHPRNESALLISMTPSIQDTDEAYYVDHREAFEYDNGGLFMVGIGTNGWNKQLITLQYQGGKI